MTHIKPEDEREKLPAEKKFDGWVYGGISYLAQALAGSGLTYWIRHAGGKPYFDKAAEHVGENVISKIMPLKGKKAVDAADAVIVVSTMVAVGTLFVAPVKWLEDIKGRIVEKWTKQDNAERTAKGDAPTAEELAHQEKLLGDLKAQPKQTWKTLLTGRFASLVPVYASVFGFNHFNKKMEAGFQSFTKGAANAAGLKSVAESKVFHNASGIAFYDGFYSMISAGGLYVYSHYICPPEKEKETPAQTHAERAKPPASHTERASEQKSFEMAL